MILGNRAEDAGDDVRETTGSELLFAPDFDFAEGFLAMSLILAESMPTGRASFFGGQVHSQVRETDSRLTSTSA
jgi:hypothetical protein